MPKAKEEARRLLITSRFYRIFAFAFVAAGVFIFAFVFFGTGEGDLRVFLYHPALLGFVIFPFIPAAFLGWRATKMEIKLQEYLTPQSKD